MLGCKAQSVCLENELPDEEYLPKSFSENIKKNKYIFFKYSDSLSIMIKDKPQEYVFEIFEYIEIWYNKKRRHGALNYKTIEEFNNQNSIYKNVA